MKLTTTITLEVELETSEQGDKFELATQMDADLGKYFLIQSQKEIQLNNTKIKFKSVS